MLLSKKEKKKTKQDEVNLVKLSTANISNIKAFLATETVSKYKYK